MTFIWMEMLWLLLAIPVLVGLYFWMLRRKKKTAVRYANLAMVRQAMGKTAAWRRHLPPALLLIALGVLILAVARPAAVVTLASARGTIILAMDVSGSMRAEDVKPNRMIAAQEAAKQFIAGQPPNVQVGIVAFAGSAILVQVPTIDRESLHQAIDRFQFRRGTAVGAGVLASLATIFPTEDFMVEASDPFNSFGPGVRRSYESLSIDQLRAAQGRPAHVPVDPGSYESAVVVLLTDGATTTGPDPIKAGQLAADYGVRVYTVGFGSREGDVISFAGRSMRAQLDSETLSRIAEITRAEYFEAESAADLTEVYNSLSTKLVAEKKLTEISFIFAGVGALFALMAATLSMLWFGRVV